MGVYSGDKALDAEIYLNLETGDLTMDYSLNKHGSPYQSNSLEIKNESKDVPFFRDRLKTVVGLIPVAAFHFMYMVIMMPLIAYLSERGVLKNPNYQVEHQKIMKDLTVRVFGTYQIVIEAPISDTVLAVPLRNNMWVGYALEGECQDKIKSIALKRNMVTRIYGDGNKVSHQRGWTLFLEFTDPPQTGKCIIDHI